MESKTGLSLDNAEASVRNLLASNVVTVVSATGSSTARGEHWTVNQATALNNGATMYLTNSLIVAVTGQTQYSGVGNVQLTSASSVFAGTGSAYHYLAINSPYRNYPAATTAINPTLLKTLRKLTTYAPLVLASDFTTDTTLSPQAQPATDDAYIASPPLVSQITLKQNTTMRTTRLTTTNLAT